MWAVKQARSASRSRWLAYIYLRYKIIYTSIRPLQRNSLTFMNLTNMLSLAVMTMPADDLLSMCAGLIGFLV